MKSPFRKVNSRCEVFRPANIDRFRDLNIRRLFTLRPPDEAREGWDIQADHDIDNDENFNRTRIEIVDYPRFDLLHLIPGLVVDIHGAINQGENVYVHWYISLFQKLTRSRMGRSRSAAVVVAYLMQYSGLDYFAARKMVQEIRRDININPGFAQQLQVWDIIKYDWENRRNYPEYQYWKMAHSAGLIARTPCIQFR
jgi:protein-tyrosine phosphatase